MNGARIEELLEELIAVQRLTLQAIERAGQASPLSRADRAALALLLPAIGGTHGSELFAARELIENPSPALRAIFDVQPLNVRQLGRLLQRGEGQAVAGYIVSRDGSELGAVLWRVMRTP